MPTVRFGKRIAKVNANSSTLHFIGLLSDGNVHSNINHLESMLRTVKGQGVKKARIHALIDGRDVQPTSAFEYIDRLYADMMRTICASWIKRRAHWYWTSKVGSNQNRPFIKPRARHRLRPLAA